MPSNKGNKFLTVAVQAAKLAGQTILKNIGRISEKDIKHKQKSDFVTRIDKESEKIIIETVKENFPDHLFFAEESLRDAETDRYRWIIDPLDGTTNYIHQYPVFSISIALEYKREMVLGVVYDPLRGELFTGEKGKGSFLNTHCIGVSKVGSSGNSLITTGFPFRSKEFIDEYLRLFRGVFDSVSDLRRAGSAALDLAYVACGRCEGFFEIGLKPWDVAAGEILIKEAGGVVTDFGGGPDFLLTGNIVAGNPAIHGILLTEVKKVFAGIIDK